MPSLQQLAVQNLLAQAASILYRIGETLGEGKCPPNQLLLKIEIATFFSEGRKSLSEALSEMEPAVLKESGQSALSAGNSGGESTWEPPGNTPSPDGLVKNMETPISPGDPSGSFSSGGTMDSPQASKQELDFCPPNYFDESVTSGRHKSSKRFLRVLGFNGNPLLVAIDDISNINKRQDLGCDLYYKSQPEPDALSTSFDTLERMLNV